MPLNPTETLGTQAKSFDNLSCLVLLKRNWEYNPSLGQIQTIPYFIPQSPSYPKVRVIYHHHQHHDNDDNSNNDKYTKLKKFKYHLLTKSGVITGKSQTEALMRQYVKAEV